ncbi:MAG: preprotein translocase subunit SecG [Clostridiales bacterium]|nr:preprotein translocase subunit SecG [Clostridiales bacterium]
MYAIIHKELCALAVSRRTRKPQKGQNVMFINLLASETALLIRDILAIATVVIMAIAALAAIILILLQQGNSTGIDALGGSSETFFGKNKGKSLESKMKKWTIICLVILLVFSVIYFVVPYNTAIWG